jgi:hypothetical protein
MVLRPFSPEEFNELMEENIQIYGVSRQVEQGWEAVISCLYKAKKDRRAVFSL